MHHAPRTAVLFVLLVAAFIAGCTSSSSTTTPPPPPVVPAAGDLLVESITVRGRLPQAGVVSVRTVADQDGAADRDFRVAFRLDGGSSTTSLPRDPGLTSAQTWTAALPIVAKTPSGVSTTDLIVTLAP